MYEEILAKDFDYLLVLNPTKMTTRSIVNYINGNSQMSQVLFICNSYYFMFKRRPNEQEVMIWESKLANPIIRESTKRDLITSLRISSEYCNVWLSPQEKLINYFCQKFRSFLHKFKRVT